MRIEALFISPGHNFFGHHGRAPGHHETVAATQVECIAGRGLRGDRFYEFKDNYAGQVTFFAIEVFDALVVTLGIPDKSPGVLRRNVITRGTDLNNLIGTEFEVQGVRFRGVTECSPCAWMNEAFAPGAKDFLAGRGGLRARILNDGVLRVGGA